MTLYLLDTGTVSYALRGDGKVAAQVLDRKPSQVAISSLTLAELRFGAEKRKSRTLHRLIDSFVSGVGVMAFDIEAANHFGKLSAQFARRGTPIGIVDTMIAAHALSLGRVLVTNDTRHYSKVAGLALENWK